MSEAVSKIGVVNGCDDEELSLLFSSTTKASGRELLAYSRKVLASVRLTYEVTGQTPRLPGGLENPTEERAAEASPHPGAWALSLPSPAVGVQCGQLPRLPLLTPHSSVRLMPLPLSHRWHFRSFCCFPSAVML